MEYEDEDKVYLELVDGQIHVKAPYGWSGVFRRNGGKWDKDKSTWIVRADMTVCRDLRSAFGKRLVIGPALNVWARLEVAKELELKALTLSHSAELEKVGVNHANLANAMANRTYQQVGAKFIEQQRRVLIADEPGLGKTLEAIAGLIESDCWRGLILVCAPLTSLRPVWETELKRFAPDAHITVGVPAHHDTVWERQEIVAQHIEHFIENVEQPHVLIINPEMVRRSDPQFPILMELEWQAIIMDESHLYLSGIKSAKENQTKTGKALMGLKLASDGVKIALSGTPMRGKTRNLWGTLHWLRPNEYTSFWRWADRYLIMTSNRYSSHVVGEIHPWRKDAFYQSLDGIMLRRTKAEVVKELPPKQRIEIFCDMTDRQEQMYRQMETKASAELIDMEDEELTAIGVLAVMTRLKQFADCAWRNVESPKPVALFRPDTSGKCGVIEEMLVERGIAGNKDERIEGNKIVIASQFTQVIDSLGEWLDAIKVDHMKITGSVSEQQRVAITAAFQSQGGPRVLLMNTRAGGVSITLDAYCDEVIIIDETWTPDDQEQLEDRIHRVSRIHQVTVYYLRAKDSIDEYIAAKTLSKDTIQKEVLDGRRGVDNLILAIAGKVR